MWYAFCKWVALRHWRLRGCFGHVFITISDSSQSGYPVIRTSLQIKLYNGSYIDPSVFGFVGPYLVDRFASSSHEAVDASTVDWHGENNW